MFFSFHALGSGSLAAMAIFERSWKKDMSKEEAIDIVVQAIEAGIFNDLVFSVFMFRDLAPMLMLLLSQKVFICPYIFV